MPLACTQAGAAEKEIPLYKHIAELAGNPKMVSVAVQAEAAKVSRHGPHLSWRLQRGCCWPARLLARQHLPPCAACTAPNSSRHAHHPGSGPDLPDRAAAPHSPWPPQYLPVPAFNIINGGSHAGNALAMQEFMIMPTGCVSLFGGGLEQVRCSWAGAGGAWV